MILNHNQFFINVPANDLSIYLNLFSIALKYSYVLVANGNKVFMLFIIAILINIKLNLLDLSLVLILFISFIVLLLVKYVDFLISNARSRPNTHPM